MKNLKLAVAIIAISISSVVSISANNTEPTSKDVKKVLRSEIVSLLGNHTYNLKQEVLNAQISVMLNNQNELVVVGITSESDEVKNYVKTKLNYKKVTVKGLKKGAIYRMPLKMQQSS